MRSFRIQERLAELGLFQSAIYRACGISRDRWRGISAIKKQRKLRAVRRGKNKGKRNGKYNRPSSSEGRWPLIATKQEIECIAKVTGMTIAEVEADLGVDTPDELTGLDF